MTERKVCEVGEICTVPWNEWGGTEGKEGVGLGKDFIFCVPQCKPDRAFEV